MKILWADQLQVIGQGYGYSTHANKMKEALTAAGVTITLDPSSPFDLAVHLLPPDLFRPIPGKNLLFTMCETAPLRGSYRVETMNQATVLVVPCRFCQREFRPFYPGPIEICPEGIDPAQFPFHQRTAPAPGEPFRFLWVGALNQRKGYDIVYRTWKRWLQSGRMPRNAQLYLKTSGVVRDGKKFTEVVHLKAGKGPDGVLGFFDAKGAPSGVSDLPGMIIDTRDLPIANLAELYRSAHAFILPSIGEGWGLTLCEALATGAPSIWTHWSGPRDFADETIGFPITKFRMIQNALETKFQEFGAGANEDQISQRYEQIYHGYDRALKLGKKASERMHSRFKWSDAAQRFIEICERYA